MRKVHALGMQTESESDGAENMMEDLFIGSIHSSIKSDEEDSEWKVFLPVGPKRDKICFKIDTGAQANVIPYQVFRKIRESPALYKTKVNLTTYNGTHVSTRGRCTLQVIYKNQSHPVDFIVANVKAEPILGSKSSIQLGLLKRIFDLNSSTVPKSSEAILDEYPQLFKGIGCIKNVTHHISLKDNPTPVIYPPRKVPESLKPKLYEELQRMQNQKIIEKIDEPTDWVNPIVLVEKSDGSIRICLDPKELNQSIRREHYKLPTIDDISAKLANSKHFSVLDASNSFWQIRLDEPSSRLTTFNTPFGRYKFQRVPFGISSASEVFQKVFSGILEGLDGVVNSIDDILIFAETKEEHDRRLRKVLERLADTGVSLKRSKCRIGVTKVKYVGVFLTGNGTETNPEKVEAITKMPYPEDKQSLQRFLGMVTFFSKFIPNLSSITAPLHVLLQKDTAWHWTEEQMKAIDTLKQLLTKAPVLSYYDINKDIVVTADASKDGIGAALLQGNHPVAFASRALTQSEQNYAQIEKETLAATFACERFHQFLYGRSFIIESDHKPLEAIVNKPLYKAPPRIQRFLLRLQKYQYKLKHVPGKHMLVADTLSRACLPGQLKSDLTKEADLQVHSLVSSLAVSDVKFTQIQQERNKDDELQKLKQTIKDGWPTHRRNLDHVILPYWEGKEEYHIVDNIIFKGSRIVVPRSMRAEMLSIIHEGHLGIEMCTRRAKEILHWSGMRGQIIDKITKCAICQRYAKRQRKEPMKPQETPSRPWQKTASDLLYFNSKDYLLVVDAYSGYFEIEMLEDTSSCTVIEHIKKIFARDGIPEQLLTDNGPQYSSRHFKEFAKEWGFLHKTSSPNYPRSNGLSERTVQTAKNLLKKTKAEGKDPYLALLTYRDSPRENGLQSPAQLLFGRKLRTQVPIATESLIPKTPDQYNTQRKLILRREKAKLNHDRHSRKTPYPTLNLGSRIRFHHGKEWVPAEFVSQSQYPRSFNIRTPDGNVIRRNRAHIKVIPQDSERERIIIPEVEEPDTTAGNILENQTKSGNTGIGTPDPPRTTRSGRESQSQV